MTCSGISSPTTLDIGKNSQEYEFTQESFETSFIIRRQKRCNFCGDILNHPSKFTFSVKCQSCSLKNSTMILPAGLVCNQCIDKSACYVFKSSKDQVPYTNLARTQSMQSPLLTQSIWDVIAKTLSMLNDQI